jgi:hypothetical protein
LLLTPLALSTLIATLVVLFCCLEKFFRLIEKARQIVRDSARAIDCITAPFTGWFRTSGKADSEPRHVTGIAITNVDKPGSAPIRI